MFYITIDGTAITEVLNSDGPFPIPAGAVQISNSDMWKLARHPQGFSMFDYVDGAVILNTEKLAGHMLMPNRREKVEEIRIEGLKRIGAIVPALTDETQLDLIVTLLASDMITAPAPGSDMDRVKDIYQYGKNKISQARAATQAQLDSYDPVTDPNWP